MKKVLHLLTTDGRRLALWLVAWCAFLVLRCLVLRTESWQTWNPSSEGSFSSLLNPWLLLVVLIPLAVQPERPHGSRAFWLTRPIAGWQMALEKALFLALAALGPMMILQAVILLDLGLALGKLPAVLFEGAVIELAVIAVLWLLAVFTRAVSGYLVALVTLLSLNLVLSGIQGAFNSLDAGEFSTWMKFISGVEITFESVVYFALTLCVVLHQYLTRRTLRSLALAITVAALAGPLVLGMGRSEDAVRECSPAEGVGARLVSPYPLLVPGNGELILSAMPRSMNLEIDGLAEDLHWFGGTLSGKLMLAGGSEVGLQPVLVNWWPLSPGAHVRGPMDMTKTKTAGPSGSISAEVDLKLSGDLDQHRGRRGVLEGEVLLHLFRVRVVGELPVAAESSFESGPQRLFIERFQVDSRLATVAVGVRRLGSRGLELVPHQELHLVSPDRNVVLGSQRLVGGQERRLVMARPGLFTLFDTVTFEVPESLVDRVEEMSLVWVGWQSAGCKRIPIRVEDVRVGDPAETAPGPVQNEANAQVAGTTEKVER